VIRQVAIFTDEPGWHGARLKEAFAARGVETRFVSLRDCRFELTRPGRYFIIPGFEEHAPEGVFVRGVPGGTLEQVVLRLDLLHALKLDGVPVYNDGRAIERTVDKAMTSFILARGGIPAPQTWVAESEREARAIVRRETASGAELVLKPLFGSQGAGLRRLAGTAALPPPEEYNGVYYLQRYIAPGAGGWHDWRVFVIGGRVRAAMIRRGRSWINNVAQGARCEAVEPGSDLCELAEGACRALEIDYGGVDLVRDRDGRALVVEVNGIPAWKGLQSVSRLDIARELVDDFLEKCLPRPALHSVA
jgi:RimK family alpha-L-glutamate ligase